jgi:hypothetical protein
MTGILLASVKKLLSGAMRSMIPRTLIIRRFEVLMAMTMKITAFWDVLTGSVVFTNIMKKPYAIMLKPSGPEGEESWFIRNVDKHRKSSNCVLIGREEAFEI